MLQFRTDGEERAHARTYMHCEVKTTDKVLMQLPTPPQPAEACGWSGFHAHQRLVLWPSEVKGEAG